MAEGVVDTLVFLLVSLAWSVPLMLLHELGHGLAALALTDGDVRIGMRATPSGLMLGECTYEPARLRHPKAEALIAAAGPVTSLLSAVVLAYGALAAGLGTDDHGAVASILLIGALTAVFQLVASALPVRYGVGLGGGDSDGRAVWRILTGAPPGGAAREDRRPERAIRPVFAVLLLAIGALTLLVDPLAFVLLAAFFALAWYQQRSDRASAG